MPLTEAEKNKYAAAIAELKSRAEYYRSISFAGLAEQFASMTSLMEELLTKLSATNLTGEPQNTANEEKASNENKDENTLDP